MAIIQISYSWSDGSAMTVSVSGKARYPDALSDLGAQAQRQWHETCAELGIVAGVEADDLEDMIEPVE